MKLAGTLKQLDLFPTSRASPASREWAPDEIAMISTLDTRTEAGDSRYCLGNRVRVISQRPDGAYLVRVEMGLVWGSPWWDDGIRLIVPAEGLAPEYLKPSRRYDLQGFRVDQEETAIVNVRASLESLYKRSVTAEELRKAVMLIDPKNPATDEIAEYRRAHG